MYEDDGGESPTEKRARIEQELKMHRLDMTADLHDILEDIEEQAGDSAVLAPSAEIARVLEHLHEELGWINQRLDEALDEEDFDR